MKVKIATDFSISFLDVFEGVCIRKLKKLSPTYLPYLFLKYCLGLGTKINLE
jgi:hypothetical protein